MRPVLAPSVAPRATRRRISRSVRRRCPTFPWAHVRPFGARLHRSTPRVVASAQWAVRLSPTAYQKYPRVSNLAPARRYRTSPVQPARCAGQLPEVPAGPNPVSLPLPGPPHQRPSRAQHREAPVSALVDRIPKAIRLQDQLQRNRAAATRSAGLRRSPTVTLRIRSADRPTRPGTGPPQQALG